MSQLTHLGMTTNKRVAQGLLKFPFPEVSQPTKLLRKRSADRRVRPEWR